MDKPNFTLNDKIFQNDFANNKKVMQFKDKKEKRNALEEFDNCKSEEEFSEWYEKYTDMPDDLCKIMGLVECNRRNMKKIIEIVETQD